MFSTTYIQIKIFGQQVQEFMRQVVARKVIVHACEGLITLNLSLITTVI